MMKVPAFQEFMGRGTPEQLLSPHIWNPSWGMGPLKTFRKPRASLLEKRPSHTPPWVNEHTRAPTSTHTFTDRLSSFENVRKQ